MKPPIIVCEMEEDRIVYGDLDIFGNIEELIDYIEPVDVQYRSCFAVDSEGRLLSLDLDSDNVRIVVKETELQPTHQEDLRKCLREFLRHIDRRDRQSYGISDEWLEDAGLIDLLKIAQTIYSSEPVYVRYPGKIRRLFQALKKHAVRKSD